MTDASSRPAFDTIVLATGNPHKVEEMRAIFAECGIVGVRFVGLGELGASTREPEETGRTFIENATIKALSYAQQTGLPCLADDSGLEVDALEGRPGVISSHYCTDGREAGMTREERDRLNNERVLKELAGVVPEKRTGRFVCVMVLAMPDGQNGKEERGGLKARPPVLLVSRGTLEGRIGIPPAVPRGQRGFGYDPLFLVGPDFRLTSAELPKDEKNRLSHRGKAARAMAAQIAQLVARDPA